MSSQHARFSCKLPSKLLCYQRPGMTLVPVGEGSMRANLEVLPSFFVSVSVCVSDSLSLTAHFGFQSPHLATWACRCAQTRNYIDVAPSNGEELRQGVKSQGHGKAWSCAVDGLATELDDGWPESVEEQSLLLLVWRRYITR